MASKQIYYPGTKLTIVHTSDATETLDVAVAHCAKSCAAQLYALVKRLGDRGRLASGDQFVNEGNGIWAIKTRCGLRAYGWYHSRTRGTFMISHYINKKRQKMLRADMERVLRNQRIYDPGDESGI